MESLPQGSTASIPSPGVILARPAADRGRLAAPWFPLWGLTRREARWDLALVVLVGLLLPIGRQVALWVAFGSGDGEAAPTAVLIVVKWFEAAVVLVLAMYLVYRHQVPAAGFGLQLDHSGRQFLWVLPTLGSLYAIMLVGALLIGALAILLPQTQEDLIQRVKFMRSMPLDDWRETLLLLVPVAIHEELLFRGLLIPLLRRAGCRWFLAIGLSTVVFALLHFTQGWMAVIQVFGVGLALALCFVRSRSLLAVTVAHFLFDLIQFQLTGRLKDVLDKYVQSAGGG